MRVSAVTMGCALLLSCSGCSPAVVAVAGVGVDADGDPVGYLRVCDDRIDGAVLYAGDDEHGRWHSTRAVREFSTWSLVGPDGSWRTEREVTGFDVGVRYELGGWADVESATASGVDFTAEDLATMRPGEVRWWAGRTDRADTRDIMSVTSEAEFRDSACRAVVG